MKRIKESILKIICRVVVLRFGGNVADVVMNGKQRLDQENMAEVALNVQENQSSLRLSD